MNTNNWKQVLGESILIPRRSQEERWKTRLDSIKRTLKQTHIEDGDLDLSKTLITNLGNLTSVGGNLYLRNTPISKMNKLQRQEIVKNVKVKGRIYYD
jgi:hypothetical protein